jgi:ribosomal protein L17
MLRGKEEVCEEDRGRHRVLMGTTVARMKEVRSLCDKAVATYSRESLENRKRSIEDINRAIYKVDEL